jgi:serine/threonine protein kinase/WD40 repeat protein
MVTGQRIGAYEMQGLLGAGGMGEVYRARDTKLGRDVAIKVLTRDVTANPDRLARFEREARLLATLNHPHIAQIYGLEEISNPDSTTPLPCLVLELVPGVTLAERLARGPLAIAEAVTIARQLAEAFDAAHEKGIIHRDLKPANIKITPDGVTKVLDFGLAKMHEGTSVDQTAAPTVDDPTRDGFIVGTPKYMSPEQARGLAVDKRTDIWAFGCVLYEMLAGRAAFAGSTIPDVLAAVVNGEPRWELLPEATPLNVTRVLRRCLEKDPKKRARDIADIAADLQEFSPATPSKTDASGASRKRAIGLAASALVGLGLIGTAAVLLLNRGATRPVERRVRFALALEDGASNLGNGPPAPSPDGQMIAFVTGTSPQSIVWVQSLDSTTARQLPGTEGAVGAIAWSPDGRWIGFFADGKLKKVAPSGGPPQTIGNIPNFQDAAWGASGQIIFRPINRAGFLGISETGGTPRTITNLDAARGENSHRFPQFLPDGHRFLFVARSSDRNNNALFMGSVDSPQPTRIMAAQSRVHYVPGESGQPGSLLFYKDGALMAQQVDLDRMSLEGEPVPVFDKVSYVAASIIAGFNASNDGRTVIVEVAGANDNALTWFGRDGARQGVLGAPGDYIQVRISPSGDRVAYSKPDERSGNRDIWYMDVSRGITSPVAVGGANEWFPVWSPNGKELLFASDRDGNPGGRPYLKKNVGIDGEEAPVPEGTASPWDWSRDGQWISSSGDGDIHVQRLVAGEKEFHFLATPALEFGGRFSPDGKWIAYVSNETGRPEVYVRPFLGKPATAESKLQISNKGGDFPTWGPNGQELFYMTADSVIYSVDTRSLGRADAVPAPVRLFEACPDTSPYLPPVMNQTFGWAFDTHDGQKFLVNCRAHPAGRYTMLLNALASR